MTNLCVNTIKFLLKIKFFQKRKGTFLLKFICLIISLLIFVPSFTLPFVASGTTRPQFDIDDAVNLPALPLCSNINYLESLFSVGDIPFLVVRGDIDGDGKLDLVTVSDFNGTLSVLRNTSVIGIIDSNSFAPKVDFAIGSFPVAIGDLDGDGRLDLATVDFVDNKVSVLRNTSMRGAIDSNSFAPRVDFATDNNPTSITIGDLDGDGKLDLAIASFSDTVSVLRNTSVIGAIDSNSFTSRVDFAIGSFLGSVALGDLDGDDRLDLAIVDSVRNVVSVLRNTSVIGVIDSNSFAPKVDFATDKRPSSVVIEDLDGDGKLDLAVANEALIDQSKSSVSVLRNTSVRGVIDSNSFATRVDLATDNNLTSIAIGDLDGDGKLDLAVANRNGKSVLVLKNTSNSGSISFTVNPRFPTGRLPSSVAIGDLDGDGKLDLAITNEGDDTISVLRNTSTTGINSFASRVDFATEKGPFSVAIGDLDGDSKLDLAIVNLNSAKVSILRNTSTIGVIDSNSFVPKVDFAISGFSIAMGDLNGDGKLDLVIAGGKVSVLRNTSTIGVIDSNSFAPEVDFATGSSPFSVAIGDLDGDNKLDLAVANFDDESVSVLRNTSTTATIDSNSFAPSIDFSIGGFPRLVKMEDLDGDSKLDLITSNGSIVSVLRNTSVRGTIDSNSFAPKVDWSNGGRRVLSVAIGDLDGDSKLDLATANFDNNTVSVLRNTSVRGTIDSNSFAPKVDFATGDRPISVEIGDLDGDGRLDLAIANISGDTVSVLRNQCQPACPTITLSPSSLPAAKVGTVYSQTITTSGGMSPYIFSTTGALPTGISLSSSGILSGTSSQRGTFSFTITTMDASKCVAEKIYTLKVKKSKK